MEKAFFQPDPGPGKGLLEKAELKIDVYGGRGISITGICPPLLQGIRASYQLRDEAFVAGKLGNMLYALFGNKENIDVSFDINQLSQFKATVLPLLKKYSNLTISPAAQQLLEEAGGLEKSQLRLDVEGDEVVGQARVFYQGKAVRLGASGERAIKRDWYKEEKLADLLEESLKAEEIVFLRIDGQTPKARRMTLVNVFNHKDSPAKVFLISLKAGGTGLNLTGADTVIHYDPWWNVAAQNQATDRAHRIGQEKKVTVYKLIAKDTVEEAILDLQEAKSQLAQAESVSSASLQKEDLLKILD